MLYINSLLRPTAISIVLTSGLAIAFNTIFAIAPGIAATLHENGKPFSFSQHAAKQTLPPPPPSNPGSSAAGGRRSPTACPQDAATATSGPFLTALSPTTEPGLTLSAHPTFLVYVPETSAATAEFSLRSQTNQGVYRTTISLTNTPGIISITLPDQAMILEVNRLYTWSFAVICDPDDRLIDQFVMGMVQRVELDPARVSQIEQASVEQRIALYQEDRLWYDALALLFELNQSQPNDSDIGTAWRELLRSGGVDTILDTNPDGSR